MSMFGRRTVISNYASLEEIKKAEKEIKQIKKDLKALEWRTRGKAKK